MADNTDEEYLNNPANTQLENPAAEIIPTKDTEPIKPKQETENMEVHHHPDLHHKQKPWKEYFLEFIMIFLAVTLGFFAENIREHVSDKGKTKVFAASLYQDFKTNSVTLAQLINYTDEKIKSVDSLNYFMHQLHNRISDSNLYCCVI